MSVALLLVTHNKIGNDMLMTTGSILDEEFKNTACVEIPMDADIDIKKQQIADTLDSMSTEDGVLILTDSYGSTPCNIAKSALETALILQNVGFSMRNEEVFRGIARRASTITAQQLTRWRQSP